MAESDDLLLSDAERLHALTVLGDHYASGRLDDSQFHARSGDVAAARTLAQLRDSFADLPGGTPLTVNVRSFPLPDGAAGSAAASHDGALDATVEALLLPAVPAPAPTPGPGAGRPLQISRRPCRRGRRPCRARSSGRPPGRPPPTPGGAARAG